MNALPPYDSRSERPRWSANGTFTEHSYRGLAPDSQNCAIFVLNAGGLNGVDQYWSYRSPTGVWYATRRPQLSYSPASYPIAALSNPESVQLFSVSDIEEPIAEWHAFKKAQTDSDVDYVFRRLYFTQTSDIEMKPFSSPIEIDNVEATGGQLVNLDLWRDMAGATHLLYLRVPVASAAFGKRFQPNNPLIHSLEHCVVENGQQSSGAKRSFGPRKAAAKELVDWGRFKNHRRR